jgi:hypothetical protein
MKLTEFTTNNAKEVTLEDYHTKSLTLQVLAQEDFVGFIYKIKDLVVNTINKVFFTYNEKAYIDSVSNQYEFTHLLKKNPFIIYKDTVVSKPENFDGFLKDYTVDLTLACKELIPICNQTLDILIKICSTYINEYSENKIMTLPQTKEIEELHKNFSKRLDAVTAYFALKNNSVKDRVENLFKNSQELVQMYDLLQELDRNINSTTINTIKQKASEASTLIDRIIDINSKSSGTFKNTKTQKDLTNSVYLVAKEVEGIGYLIYNAVTLYNIFKNITTDITFTIKSNKEAQ